MKANIMQRIVTAIAVALAVGAALQAPAQEIGDERRAISYWTDSRRGWHFYEDPETEPAEQSLPKAPPAINAKPRKPPEIAAFEHLQKQLNEYRNIAIMRPTEANVRRYMELEAKVVRRASLFADVAQRVTWSTPELDPTLQGRPVNAKALQVFDHDQLQARARSIAALGRDHVLFFFFRSDCPYCHAFAPTLAAFQVRYGINVVPISIDGGGIPGFPEPRRDNGIASTLHVKQVPAVFLAQPFTGKITPVGFGILSESQLLERISIISTSASEALLPGAVERIKLQ